MRLNQLLTHNQPVEATVWEDDSDDVQLVFASQVISIVDQRFMLSWEKCGITMGEGDLAEVLKPGMVLGVVVNRQGKPPLVLYPTVDVVKVGQGIWLAQSQAPEHIGEIRRKHVRVEIEIDMRLEYDEAGSELPAKTIDLSGGGVKFYCGKMLMQGRQIRLQWQFKPEEPRLDVAATIVSVSQNSRSVDDQDIERYVLACQFDGLEDWEETLIMRHCFHHQLGLQRPES